MTIHPSRTCNLLTVLPQPPWRQPLDWDLRMTWECEKRVFFPAYVKQHDTSNPSQRSLGSFPHFQRLPAELQVRILSCCPAPTLWQLMRVSSTLRIESSKLFWASPSASFLLSADWLLGGGYAGRTYHDLSFLRHVQNVEIECHCLYDELWPEHKANDPFCPEDARQDVVDIMWTTLRKTCPRIKSVVFNHQKIMSSIELEGAGNVPECLKALIQACPRNIVAEVSTVEEREGRYWNNGTYSDFYNVECRRAHYRPLQGGGWEELVSKAKQDAVLVPGRRFRGIVGQFEKSYFLFRRRVLQERAFWPLVIEALDRYHFDDGRNNAFQCPNVDCGSVFTKPGEWTIHAATTKHGWAKVEDGLFDILPPELRAVFETKFNLIEAKQQASEEGSTKMSKDWNEEGEERRKEMEQEFLQQLENDADWATGEQAVDHQIWKNFIRVMHPEWNGL
ncbi:unnamed protein product [Alternaria alternata]